MLPRSHRLTSGPAFGRTIRRGARAGTATVVVHVLLAGPPGDQGDSGGLVDAGGEPVAGRDVGSARAGLVVGRAVGPAVVRNRVKRRLRHLLRERLDAAPDGTLVVVRALPPAATAARQLVDDLDDAWRRALGKALRAAGGARDQAPRGDDRPRADLHGSPPRRTVAGTTGGTTGDSAGKGAEGRR